MMNTTLRTTKYLVALAGFAVLFFLVSKTQAATASQPVIQTIYANDVSATTAVLPAAVNPMNSSAVVYFEYGPSGTFSYTTPKQAAGVGSYDRTIRMRITGLQPGTAYTFRAVAESASGIVRGDVQVFTTPGISPNLGNSNNPYNQPNYQNNNYPNYQNLPGYQATGNNSATPTTFGQTLPAIYVSGSSASLRANINPQGIASGYYFEYGADQSFSNQTGVASAGVGSYGRTVGTSVGNLIPGTTYSYRVVIQLPQGIIRGDIMQFTTPGALPAVTTANLGNTSGNTVTRTTSSPTATTRTKPRAVATAAPRTNTATSPTASQKIATQTANVANSTGSWFTNFWNRLTGKTTPTPTDTATASPIAEGPVCATVSPSLTSPSIIAKQEAVYAITYRNNCTFPLGNASLTVHLPPEVDFMSTDYPFTISDGNALTFTVGTVPPGTELAVNIRTAVKSSVKSGDSLTIGAMLAFAGERGRSESVSALAVSRAIAGPSFLASVGSTLQGIFGRWFVSLILICAILGLLFWHFFRERQKDSVQDLVLNIEHV